MSGVFSKWVASTQKLTGNLKLTGNSCRIRWPNVYTSILTWYGALQMANNMMKMEITCCERLPYQQESL